VKECDCLCQTLNVDLPVPDKIDSRYLYRKLHSGPVSPNASMWNFDDDVKRFKRAPVSVDGEKTRR